MKLFFLMALAALALAGCGSGTTPYSPASFSGTVATPTPVPTASPISGDSVFPDFGITVPIAPDRSTPKLGADGTLAVTLTVRKTSALATPVTLSTGALPAGVSATFSPATVTPTGAGLPVVLTIRAMDPSKPGSVEVIGKSGSVERTASVGFAAYVAPSTFSVVATPVAGNSSSSLVRQFDVTVSQTSDKGAIQLFATRNLGRSGVPDYPLVPDPAPEGTTFSGLPSSVTLTGTTSQTFRLTVTLGVSATFNPSYSFSVVGSRDGRTESIAVLVPYTGLPNQ